MTGIRDEHTQIKILNRRLLIDELLSLGDIGGQKDLVDFLRLTWELDEMRSTDYRFQNAADDIWKHMICNDDWTYIYLFDNYLNLINDSDQQLFRFLENVVHPLVRLPDEQERYVEIVNKHLLKEGFQLQIREEITSHKVYNVIKVGSGVNERVKNLIFASNGLKPRIVLADAVSNNIRIAENEQYCLIYDSPIPQTGLLWSDLIVWWAKRESKIPSIEVERSLYKRLLESLSPQSPPERKIFKIFFRLFRDEYGGNLPALIPQVYLHYDPYTIRELKHRSILSRQRMDFLLLFSNHERIVIEIDGQQHYADEDEKANPKKYAEMVAADRSLRLAGYEIYRFGGSEFQDDNYIISVESFFRDLFKKHGVTAKG
jgi:hypothetical protein